jgi:hypothetical protein
MPQRVNRGPTIGDESDGEIAVADRPDMFEGLEMLLSGP